METFQGKYFALITGASVGIGAAFAQELAAEGYSLVLTGRNEKNLADLAQSLHRQFGIETEVLVADLLKPDDVKRLKSRLQDSARPVEMLVNNAGFGLGKNFLEAPLSAHLAQIDVLAKVPLQLMYAALTAMEPRGRGRIINVASVAAYTPGGTYAAAKRFLLSISRSAHLQFSLAGISITAVSPGLTHSEFHRTMKVKKPTLPAIFWQEPQQIAKAALKANLQGKAEVIPSPTYKVLALISRAIPANIIGWFIGRTRNY